MCGLTLGIYFGVPFFICGPPSCHVQGLIVFSTPFGFPETLWGTLIWDPPLLGTQGYILLFNWRSLVEGFFFWSMGEQQNVKQSIPKLRFLTKKNEFSKIPVRDAQKTKMATRFWSSRGFSQLSWKECIWEKKLWEPFFKNISWATICTLFELCSSFGSGVITW